MSDPVNPRPRYTKRAVEAWSSMTGMADDFRIANAFGLDLSAEDASADWAPAVALADLGVRFAMVVREPSYTVKPYKAQRDAALERPTMHLAPLWRHPLGAGMGQPAERGIAALMLPVCRDDRAAEGFAETLSLTALGDEDFAANIADLVAIPLDGGRPMSMTGYTVAVGVCEAVDGALTLFGSGRVWLEAHLAQVRAITADTPGHLVEQLHFGGEVPEGMARPEQIGAPGGVLVLEPAALEWRVCRYDCVIPAAAAEVHCPDSRKLAELIDQAMRKKEPVRAYPTVRGPAVNKTERVAA